MSPVNEVNGKKEERNEWSGELILSLIIGLKALDLSYLFHISICGWTVVLLARWLRFRGLWIQHQKAQTTQTNQAMVTQMSIRSFLVLLCCIILLETEVVIVHGQLLGKLFSKCPGQETGCFLGLFGYTMIKTENGGCRETCTMFRISGWKCGNCIGYHP